jgi:hypothetical protein
LAAKSSEGPIDEATDSVLSWLALTLKPGFTIKTFLAPRRFKWI